MSLTNKQLKRYSRNIVIKSIGIRGQEKLLHSSVVVIGAGGLGSAALMYLAAAGVGHLGIVDSDRVDISNLQRQILHNEKDIGKPKTVSARAKLKILNSDVRIDVYQERITTKNIGRIIRNYDFVIDAADNFPVKFLINDACVIHRKAFSHAGVLTFAGQILTYIPGSACLRCVFPEPPDAVVPGCKEAGILGAVAGLVGTVQALEAVKYFLRIGELLVNRVMHIDGMTMNIRIVSFKKRSRCPFCSGKQKRLNPKAYEEWSCK